jgi:histone acetyltransferase (RNA polymerase elongator complex component)
LDESGVVEDAGTSHFVLVAVAIPAATWKDKDAKLSEIKNRHRVADREIHTAWMMRSYPEQERITGFAAMSDETRRLAMKTERKADLAKASLKGHKAVATLAKSYQKTNAYVHLTRAERIALVREFADTIGHWTDSRIFGDAQEKSAHVGNDRERIREHAFEQLVTRFHTYLRTETQPLGMLVHDQNQTASTNLTALMRAFHKRGTAYSKIPYIIETPLFVDSELTSMVQAADLVGYAVRRFFENKETDLFERVYPRFDRRGSVLVGLRHYTGSRPCPCRVCIDHGRQ